MLARRLDAARVAAEPAAGDELVERCARLPLALAIVAARAATHRRFPLAAIAEELRRATGGLAAFTGSEAAVDVRSVFSWSYATLQPAAARLFRLLALHPSPPASVEAAASLAGVPPEEVRPLLNELTGTHLVGEPACGRYAFHDLLRAYAAELCLTVGSPTDRQAALGRMIDHYLHSAYAADRRISPTRPPLHLPAPAAGATARKFPDEANAVAWLTAERPALLAALDAAHTGGLDGQAWRLAWSLEQYLERWGHWADWTRTWHTAMRAARRLDDPYALAQAHRGLGLIALVTGTAEEATPHFVEATTLFQRVGDVEGQAIAQRGLSFAQERQGRRDLALRHSELALELCRSAGDRSGEGLALNLIALQRTRLGDHDAAVPIVELAIALLAEVGSRRGEAAAWDTLGSVRDAAPGRRDRHRPAREGLLSVGAPPTVAPRGRHSGVPRLERQPLDRQRARHPSPRRSRTCTALASRRTRTGSPTSGSRSPRPSSSTRPSRPRSKAAQAKVIRAWWRSARRS